ncbi:MAG: lipid-A-disaccharide synthase [Alphaproteobacteria bacterium]|nr:lipid-A-disaccharide synthase [Alphaproteobacteria bacterium]
MRVFLIAGEPSGDVLGGRLITALRHLVPHVTVDGVGGTQMADAGLVSRFPMAELSLMGVAEVLPHLPRLIRRIGETAAAVRETRPDVLVTIDAPAFTLRVAKRLAGIGVPRVHYVAPQVWAWRAGRAKHLADAVDALLCLLPFEPPWFTPHGLDARFVGHPVVEAGIAAGDRHRFRARHGLGERPVLVVLPGSRRGELRRHLPVFKATVADILAAAPEVQVVIPTLAHLMGAITAATADWPGSPLVVSGEQDKHDAFRAADAALAASGTVALELALAGCPSVIAYRVNPLTAALARRLLTTHYVSLPNIIADRVIYPECLQERCAPGPLVAELMPLLREPSARRAQRSALADVATALGDGGEAPSVRAGKAVLDIIAAGSLIR